MELPYQGQNNHFREQVATMITFSSNIQAIDWHEAVIVFERAPLGRTRREADQLRRAFAASYACIFAWAGKKLIGLGRALCDGEYQAARYDLVVLPEYQGMGLGREMVKKLCDRLPVENIILYAVPGREGFYQKCGFTRMLTAMAKLNPSMSDPASGYLDGSPYDF